MHTNDTHAHLEQVAKRVTAVNNIRENQPDALLVDAGDVFSGTLYFNQYEGQADLAFMNLMDYDLMTFGNHEFDLGNSAEGHQALADFIKGAEFPIVSSNVDLSADDTLKDLFNDEISAAAEGGNVYNGVIKKIDGEKVGFFGLTTEETSDIGSPANVTFENYIEEAEKAVASFEKAGVNKIVAITHIGYGDNPNVDNDQILAKSVEGIDVIVGGHDHTKLTEPVVVATDLNGQEKDPTVIVQAYQYGEFLGTLDVDFDEEGRVIGQAGQLIKVADQVADADAAAMLAEYDKSIDELKNTSTGAFAVVELENPRDGGDTSKPSVRKNETALGNLITDSMLATAQQYNPDTVIAFQNGGGIRAGIDQGDISYGDVLTVLPFGNTLATMTLTGAEIKEALEHSVDQYPSESGAFLHTSGMKYTFDSSKEAGNRIKSMQVKQKDGSYAAIEENKTYVVAVNAFTAAGGDGYDVFKKAYAEGRVTDYGLADWETFKNYLAGLKTVNPQVEGRITDVAGAADEDDVAYTDLIISEYVEGSSFNKAIELYNGTASAIDLSDYSLELYINAAANNKKTVKLSGTLESGATYVIYNSKASDDLKSKGQLENDVITSFNGDDPIVLKKAEQIIDSIGKVGTDRFVFGTDVTLVRNNDITTGDTIIDDAFDASAWTKLNKDDFSNLGKREVSESTPEKPETPENPGTPEKPEQGKTLTISEIQGAAHKSPYEGEKVTDVEGIVTYVDSNNKFYMQSQTPDNDDKTSDGIEVYKKAHGIKVGDVVAVDGTVGEYRSSSRDNDLTTTQIEGTNIEVKATGQELPEPIVLDVDRKIPTEIIDNDSFGTFDPEEDGIDFYESLEGMLVQVNNPKIVAPQAYGDLIVVPETVETTNDFGGMNISADDYNPERITLNVNDKTLQVNAGDKLNGNVSGVIGYDYGNFVVQMKAADLPEIISSGKSVMEDTTTIKKDSSKLSVATYNIENFAAGDKRVTDIAKAIVNNLNTPDIVQLTEVQDDSGATDDGVTSAAKTYESIINAITALGGPKYAFTEIAPENNKDGGAPGGNIRVGMIYNTERVSLTEGIAAGTTTDAVAYENGNLTLNPGRIDPTNEAFASSRKPLAAQFEFNGEQVIVIANHYNSKGGDLQLFGDVQPVTLKSEVQRNKIATIVNNFVADIHTKNPDANVIVLGDFNDYQFSSPLKTTAGSVLTNMIDKVPANDRFTYMYQGNSQVLDHILVSNKLANSTEVDIVHINSPFYNQVSDHDPVLIQAGL